MADEAKPLEDVLIAFQKSLARAHRQAASVRHHPAFFLGEQTLFNIEGLDIDLKVALSAHPEWPCILVNFRPDQVNASSVRFRVQAKPLEAIESGLLLFRVATQNDDAETKELCVCSIAGGRPFPGKLVIHLLPRVPHEGAESVPPLGQPPAPTSEAKRRPEEVAVDAQTDYLGMCRIIPSIDVSGEVILSINGEEKRTGFKEAMGALIYVSAGSTESGILTLFPE